MKVSLSPTASVSETSITGKGKRGKNPKKNKKEESKQTTVSSNQSIVSNEPIGTAKQYDLLESIRKMINTAITTSSTELKSEFTSLKSTVKQQLTAISEKETRHHTELKTKFTSEMDKIQMKLKSFDNIRKDMEINTIKLHHKLDILEAK